MRLAAQMGLTAGSVLPARMSVTTKAACSEMARSPFGGVWGGRTSSPSVLVTCRMEVTPGLRPPLASVA